MEGNIYIKGNLYTNHPMDNRQLMSDGITIHVQEDAVFSIYRENCNLKEDDVFIDDLFNKFNIKDIIAFENF